MTSGSNGDRQFTHDEENLQQPAIQWLIDNKGYFEVFCDQNAHGERVDSIGYLQNRLHLIEVKPNHLKFRVWYDPNKCNSIESKISGSLRNLYGAASPHWQAIRAKWDKKSKPIFVLLCGSYSDNNLSELQAMLQARADEWFFDWSIWLWNGIQIIEKASGKSQHVIQFEFLPDIAIPIQKEYTRRNPKQSLEDIQHLANATGVGALFAHAMEEATRLNFKIKTGNPTVTLYSGKISVASIRPTQRACPDRSKGLNIGINHLALKNAALELPGTPAHKSGFMMTNRFCATSAEITELLELLK